MISLTDIPAPTRRKIARTAAAVVLELEPLDIPNASKLSRATAEGMRRLKDEGMPEAVRDALGTVLDSIGDAADVALLSPNDCCDPRALAVVRMLLRVGIDSAVSALREKNL